MGWPGEDGVLLPPEVLVDHLGTMRSSSILLEDDPFEVLEEVVNGPSQLILQNNYVGATVETLWEAAGPTHSFAGQEPHT